MTSSDKIKRGIAKAKAKAHGASGGRVFEKTGAAKVGTKKDQDA